MIAHLEPPDGPALRFESGRVSVVTADTEQGPTVLALLAGGRMRGGTLRITPASTDPRRAIALVDAPGACEPSPGVRLSAVVAEELALAGRPSGRRSTLAFLAAVDGSDFARTRIEAVPPALRLRVLCELAALRPGTEALVITSPDRHNGEGAEWMLLAEEFASRGLAVLVVTSRGAAAPASARTTLETAPA